MEQSAIPADIQPPAASTEDPGENSKEPLSEDVTECIGDCSAAVDLQRVNDQGIQRSKEPDSEELTLEIQKLEDLFKASLKSSELEATEIRLKDSSPDTLENDNDKNTMTDSLVDVELLRLVNNDSSPEPPTCPDVPLSESESEMSENNGEFDLTSAQNLYHLKLMKIQKAPVHRTYVEQEYSHFCFQCLDIPDEVCKSIEDKTGINRKQCETAACLLIQYLKTPKGAAMMSQVTTKEEKIQRKPILPKRKLTKDQKICYFLHRITSQKGAWAVFEDDSVILPLLANLNRVMEKIDTQLFKVALKRDQYRGVRNLVVYFIREKRWSVRSELLGTFDLMATKDDCALSVLILSDLPIHLALAVQNAQCNCTIKGECNCDDKITLYAGMLTTLLRSGDSMPSAHAEYLDADFVLHLLGKIESYRNGRRDHPMSFVYMKLVLALNIQFDSSEVFENPVISALSIMPKLTMFKYKLMNYLTEKEDALDAFKYETTPPYGHSSMKLLEDVLCCMHTTTIFNRDEIKFMFETLLSHLENLTCYSRIRTPILRNLRVLLCKLKYEHPQIKDLVKTFKSILQETSSSSKQDKKCVHEMVNALSVFRLCTDINTKFTAL